MMTEYYADRQRKWDLRFLSLAKEIAQWSKDPSTKVGAVIVRPDMTIASVGYNGFPRGMKDDDYLYANRDIKLSRIIHAEMNVILNAKEVLRGYTLYTWPMFCCDHCAIHVIQSGIHRVVSPKITGETLERWRKHLSKSQSYFSEANVFVKLYTMS